MGAILEPSRCPWRLLGRQINAGAKAHGPSCSAQNPASRSYGSSRACNATSVGSPADSKSPVALRVLARARIAVSWCGRFPAGGERFVMKRPKVSVRGTSPHTSRVLHAPPSVTRLTRRVPWLCVSRSRGGCRFASSDCSVQINRRAASCELSPRKNDFVAIISKVKTSTRIRVMSFDSRPTHRVVHPHELRGRAQPSTA